MYIQKIKKLLPLVSFITVLLIGSSAAFAGGTVTYTGQGFNSVDGTYTLKDQRCGAAGEGIANDGSTGLFANWNGVGMPYQPGQAYLVWVLTVNGATGATLTLPDGTVAMINVGGTYKYASKYFTRTALVEYPVTATYTGNVKGKVTLTVSHGCPGFLPDNGNPAWCSPGYWGNAADAGWALTGFAKTDLFNLNVYSGFYGATYASDPTLYTVLSTSGGTYKGSGVAGTDPRTQSPYNALNAFNATGAFLTDHLPGYTFEPTFVGQREGDLTCPVDNHGNWKKGTIWNP